MRTIVPSGNDFLLPGASRVVNQTAAMQNRTNPAKRANKTILLRLCILRLAACEAIVQVQAKLSSRSYSTREDRHRQMSKNFLRQLHTLFRRKGLVDMDSHLWESKTGS